MESTPVSMFRAFECGICLETKDCFSVTCNNLLYGHEPDPSDGCGYRICFSDYVAMTQTGRTMECPICKKQWMGNVMKYHIRDSLIVKEKESPHVDSKICRFEDCCNFASKLYGSVVCNFHYPNRYTSCKYKDANGYQPCSVFVDSGDDEFDHVKEYYCSQHAKYKSSVHCARHEDYGCTNLIPFSVLVAGSFDVYCGRDKCTNDKRVLREMRLNKLKRKLFIPEDPIDFLSGEVSNNEPSEEEKLFLERQARLKREVENKWFTVVKTLRENPSSNVKFDINIVID
jgi:hypothetical protein